ncbi:MAG: methylated-DNA--[protein]-cysteine S-methyltransferase [Planctomycetales bacterium]|nr:methylated-DNA--[protein]-cysteine S-methyltransferase [bacterium]UNM07182.1 MAG: methylated-DNA--[protein]-cysteine S-methyltransferase [Planctomycetales bacterium]
MADAGTALYWDSFETPFGEMYGVASESGLRVLMRTDARYAARCHDALHDAGQPLFGLLRRELVDYAAGRLQRFSIPLDLQGTEFQKQVWGAVAAIPFGETRSYSGIARELGNDGAVRAVGHANGRNPVHIIIPCHRVLGGDGSLRGYAGGLDMKRRLLEIEGHPAVMAGGRQEALFG